MPNPTEFQKLIVESASLVVNRMIPPNTSIDFVQGPQMERIVEYAVQVAVKIYEKVATMPEVNI